VTWALDIPGEKVRSYRDTRGPDVASARRLAAGLQRQDARGARDRAILRLLWDLGLRRTEVAELDLDHLDLEAGTVEVREKGEHDRIPLTLPDETRVALQAWLDVRGREPGPLFVSLDHATASRASEPQRLSATLIYREVRKLGDRVQVKARPHGVRHGAITAVLDLNGGNVRAAQQFSRHKDVRTLLRYDDNRQEPGRQDGTAGRLRCLSDANERRRRARAERSQVAALPILTVRPGKRRAAGGRLDRVACT
jgi:integrase/recombinase XerC